MQRDLKDDKPDQRKIKNVLQSKGEELSYANANRSTSGWCFYIRAVQLFQAPPSLIILLHTARATCVVECFVWFFEHLTAYLARNIIQKILCYIFEIVHQSPFQKSANLQTPFEIKKKKKKTKNFRGAFEVSKSQPLLGVLCTTTTSQDKGLKASLILTSLDSL